MFGLFVVFDFCFKFYLLFWIFIFTSVLVY